jgi:hypothetical protein
MSGGKGGGQSTKTEIPVWAEEATKRNLARAEDVQRIGYMPYYGPDVAAFNPTQQLAMQNNMDAAAAFGLASPGQDAMAGMPRATNYNGIQGYSSGGLYDQAVAEFERNKPGYAREYNDLFAKNSSSNVPSYPTPPYPNFPVGGVADLNIPAGAGQQFPGPVIPNINVMDNYGKNMTSMPKMPDVDFSITPPNSDLSMTSPSQIPLTSMPQMPQLPQMPAQMPAQIPQIPSDASDASAASDASDACLRCLRCLRPQIPQMVFERNMMPGQVGMAGPQQPLMQDVKDAGYPVITALPIPAAMPTQNIDDMMKELRNTRSIF